MSLKQWLKNPKKEVINSYKVQNTRKKFSVLKGIKAKTTAEEEYLDEIERFERYMDKRKVLPTLKDYIDYAESIFKKDHSLYNLYQNMSREVFREGISKLYEKYIKDNYSDLEKILKKGKRLIKGKTKNYHGVEFKTFNVIFTKRGMRFINKQTGRFIKKPNPSDFI